jgi:hypothetical protein
VAKHTCHYDLDEERKQSERGNTETTTEQPLTILLLIIYDRIDGILKLICGGENLEKIPSQIQIQFTIQYKNKCYSEVRNRQFCLHEPNLLEDLKPKNLSLLLCRKNLLSVRTKRNAFVFSCAFEILVYFR